MEFRCFITCRRGNEDIVASYLKEMGWKALPRPKGYVGIVLSDCTVEDAYKIPEVEHAYPIHAECSAELEEIVKVGSKLAEEKIPPASSFAVRTERRGKHTFTSLDVNRALGAAILEKVREACVDLTSPEYVVFVNIIDDKAYLSVIKGKELHKKYVGKKDARRVFSKIRFVQMVYWGTPEGCYEIGRRIGRAAQAFEINRLILAILDPIRAEELKSFIEGVLEGIECRYEVQEKGYGREVKKIGVYVDSLYQIIRRINKNKHGIIITDPAGQELSKVRKKIAELFKSKRYVYIFAGSREGIPKGLFRFADVVVDLAPYITFATEHTIPVALSSIYWAIEDLL